MAIYIYAISVFILWITGKRFGQKVDLKHAVYTKFLCPALLIILGARMKRDILNKGSMLMFLYGKSGNGGTFIVHWSAKISAFIIFACYPVLYLSIIRAGYIEMGIACMMPVLGFFMPDMDLQAKIRKKKSTLLSDYPVFCTDLAVMAGAGLNLMDSWEKASARSNHSVFYLEARLVLQKTNAGMLFRDALKEFSANLPLPEVNTFVAIISQEIKSGSGGMAGRLRECAIRSWKTREDAASKKGEEAASKIIFPLAIGLAGILLILASPAVLIMKGL
ncbi:MAG: type II secretion system F family protein [Clostridia bacterium]|nr:type II secretion system F family protein [Clostridia bacterium]